MDEPTFETPAEPEEFQPEPRKRSRSSWFWISVLIEILLVAGYFRFVGLDWDQEQHLHPDERFLTMVTSALDTPKDVSGYFDTALSPLNPHNKGYTFYVYGDLPIFMVRYMAGWLDMVDYNQVNLVGRAMSAGLDLITILLIFLLADELFRSKRLALLAAAFDALAVLQIQLAHYFTVDIPANFFIFSAFYIAVRIQTAVRRKINTGEIVIPKISTQLFGDWKSVIPYALFGLAAGMAMASKISAAPLVLLLPAAGWVWWDRQPVETRKGTWLVILRNLAIGAFIFVVAFRIFQPYAFQGPGLLSGLNPKWLQNMAEIQAQTNGDVDAPFALQWARRPITFAWTNMVEWGLGWPLGLLAWAGFLWMAYRMLKGEWRKYLLLWGWTAGYFSYMSLQGNPSMRYQIPVYPTLAIMAAWFVFQIWESRPAWLSGLNRVPWQKVFAFGLGLGVLGATFAWALAFSQIYLRPVTRVEATKWIYQNVPGPINLHVQTATGISNQQVSYPYDTAVRSDKPYTAYFSVPAAGGITDITIPKIDLDQISNTPVPLQVTVTDVDAGNAVVGEGSLQVQAANSSDQPFVVSLLDAVTVVPNHRYGLTVAIRGGNGGISITDPIQFKLYANFGDQSVPFPAQPLQAGSVIDIPFSAQANGELGSVRLPVDVSNQVPPYNLTLSAVIFDRGELNSVIGSSTLKIENDAELDTLNFTFESPVELEAGQLYSLAIEQISPGTTVSLTGHAQMFMLGDSSNVILPYPVQLVADGSAYIANFNANYSGQLGEVFFPYMSDQNLTGSGLDDLEVTLVDGQNGDNQLARGSIQQDLHPSDNPRGYAVTVKFDKPAEIVADHSYFLRIGLKSPGILALRGTSPANESTWDDGLPLRMDGYDGYGGLYQRDLRFEMYWDDNADKLTRFEDTLAQSDYIFITSNRQWGSLTRAQERYPLSTAYYRYLLGCPPEKEIIWCYSVAEPGMFQGKLGFDLVKISQSDPNLGSLQINDQFAEEAWTVYDHPKVLIFKKSSAFSPETVKTLLSAVNLSMTVHVTPKGAPSYPANLMLPDYLLTRQQLGGTWTDLFNRAWFINLSPFISLVLWYLAIMLLGWIIFPFVRLAMGRLPDRGYPLARTAGMVVLAYIVWMASSNGIPFTQGTIAAVLGILIVVNAGIAYWRRVELKVEWKQNRRYYVAVELITLAFFTLDLLIRLGNPDLWHPAKGGEKPMDFSYLNAVLKSSSFPPYDPWFAGGFINYYYYGFVLIGTLIKGLGIVPSVAYNLALPTLFAMVAMGAFSMGWNLVGGKWHKDEEIAYDTVPLPPRWLGVERKPLIAGLSAAVSMLILGNLGTVKMIWEGFQRIVVSPDVMDKANIFSRMAWTVQGFIQWVGGTTLPYGTGEWYWNPSRAIPGEPITEFPFFTFLYADPHAHLIALPVTLLALAWALSILKGRWQWGGPGRPWTTVFHFGASFLLGGLAIGALRPTNTWDMPAYLGLGILAVLYSAIRYGQIPAGILPAFKPVWKRIVIGVGAAVLLVGMAFLLYQPFATWFAQGYNSFDPNTGDRTPMWAYTMHWGVFLFIIASWFIIETLDWMAKTPVSALSRVRPYSIAILLAALGVLVVGLTLSITTPVAWLVVLLAVWAAILIFRPGQSDAKRAVLVMTGLALVLTFVVEIFVLHGAGRMNTVFKFYLQAWTLFSISAAAALWWLLPAASVLWTPRWRQVWLTAASLLIFGAALFPLFGGTDKIRDRMSTVAPHTLDGMTYMNTSTYSDQGQDMDLSQDYRAIIWMQNNVQGSPVIVEANTSTYRWGTRFTIYTGLPGVLGWDYHQTQQRSVAQTDWVTSRVGEIKDFYSTTDLAAASHFLALYNVKYIILGQLEQAYYPGPGLVKFANQNGKLWNEVYRDLDTVIYEVIN